LRDILSLDSFATFGALLKYLRQRQQLTQHELGLAVGYGDAQINRLERNTRLPDLDIVIAQFVPALHLEDEPLVVARLIELAAQARGEQTPTSLTFSSTSTSSISSSQQRHEFAAAMQVKRSVKRRTNLPATITHFIGRKCEVAEVRQLLRENRLVTLTGAGGVGKTRLAQETISELLDTDLFADGIWYVELAALADSALVPQSVAAALKLIERSGHTPADTVADYFAGKQVLLILDNCEHLIASCADLAVHLLKLCPGLHLLVTSRETLHIPGEVVHRVPSLSFPDPQRLPTVERLLEFEAVRLFVDRTRGVLPHFAVTAQNAEPLAQVCQRLDGIPLAIELAAARMTMMSVEQIAARLDDRFRLLTGSGRSALPQHTTLRALIDWSYDLLSDAEQRMLRCLSVFAGGWTLEAAEVIVGDGVRDSLDVLAQLVNKSLVTVEHADVGPTRYRMLETIRQYAQDRLLERDEVGPTRDRHLSYFLQLAERAEPELRRADQVVWLDRLEADLSNLRAALEWSLQRDHLAEAGLRLAAMLMWFWHIRDRKFEGVDWLERTLLAEVQTRGIEPLSQARILARSNALNAAGFLTYIRGNHAKQVAFVEEGLALSRELGDGHRRSTAFAQWILADVAYGQQNIGRAQALFEESLALYQEIGDQFGVAECLYSLGDIMFRVGDDERATMLQERSLALRKEIGDKDGMAEIYRHLGRIALWKGDLHQAIQLTETSQTLFREVGNKWGMVVINYFLGRIALVEGKHEQAFGLSNQALALAQDIVDRPLMADAHKLLGEIALSQGMYEQAAWHYDHALTLYGALDAKSARTNVLCSMGHLVLAQGDPEQATERFEEAITIGRKLDDQFNIANALSGLAQVALAKSDYASAYALCKEALMLLRKISDPWEIVRALNAFAVVMVVQGQAQQAIRLFGSIENLYRLIRWTQSPFQRQAHEQAIVSARAQLAEASSAEWARGAEMTLDEAVEFALVEDRQHMII